MYPAPRLSLITLYDRKKETFPFIPLYRSRDAPVICPIGLGYLHIPSIDHILQDAPHLLPFSLPDFKTLHTEYRELTEKKDKLYQEYGKLKKKVKQYDTIKQNVDTILRQARQPEKEHKKER